MKSNLLGLLAAGAALLACAPHSARADNLYVTQTTAAQAWTGSNSQAVYLSGGGVTILNVTNPLAGYVSMTFNAECRVRGPSSSWLILRVYIDNILAAPSGSDTAFCSGSGTSTTAAVSRPSIVVGKSLSAGAHTFKIYAQVIGSHTQTFLDDTTTVIER